MQEIIFIIFNSFVSADFPNWTETYFIEFGSFLPPKVYHCLNRVIAQKFHLNLRFHPLVNFHNPSFNEFWCKWITRLQNTPQVMNTNLRITARVFIDETTHGLSATSCGFCIFKTASRLLVRVGQFSGDRSWFMVTIKTGGK